MRSPSGVFGRASGFLVLVINVVLPTVLGAENADMRGERIPATANRVDGGVAIGVSIPKPDGVAAGVEEVFVRAAVLAAILASYCCHCNTNNK